MRGKVTIMNCEEQSPSHELCRAESQSFDRRDVRKHVAIATAQMCQNG